MSLLMDSGGIRRPNGLTKIKHLQEGGTDTKYFHLVANGKKNGFILCLISRKHDLSSQEELETWENPPNRPFPESMVEVWMGSSSRASSAKAVVTLESSLVVGS